VLSYRLQAADENSRLCTQKHSARDRGQTAEDSRFLRRCWKVHPLTGGRKGTWSLSVTGNRRLTFTIDDDREICDLNLEDYH